MNCIFVFFSYIVTLTRKEKLKWVHEIIKTNWKIVTVRTELKAFGNIEK